MRAKVDDLPGEQVTVVSKQAILAAWRVCSRRRVKPLAINLQAWWPLLEVHLSAGSVFPGSRQTLLGCSLCVHDEFLLVATGGLASLGSSQTFLGIANA